MSASVLNAVVILVSVSFIIYGITCIGSARMKQEFERFQLPGFAPWIGILEIAAGIAMLIGLAVPWLLLLATGGLTLLMAVALFVRIRVGDTLWQSSPAVVFFLLTGWLFFMTVQAL